MSLISNLLIELRQLNSLFQKHIDLSALPKFPEYEDFIEDVGTKKRKLQVINALVAIASYLLVFQFLGLYSFSIYKDSWDPDLTYLIMAYIILADLICLASGAFLYHALNKNEIENKKGTVNLFIWITMITLINLNFLITFCSAINGGSTLGIVLVTSFILSAMMFSWSERRLISIYMFILFCIGLYALEKRITPVYLESIIVYIAELAIFNFIGGFFVNIFKNMTAVKFAVKSKTLENEILQQQINTHKTKEKLIIDMLEDELLHNSIDFTKYQQLNTVESVSYLFKNYTKNVLIHQKTYQEIFNHFEQAIVILDKDNLIVEYNHAASNTLGISDDSIRNTDFFEHFGITDQLDVSTFNLNLLNNGVVDQLIWNLQSASGQNKKIFMRSIAQIDRNDVLIGSYNFIREIHPNSQSKLRPTLASSTQCFKHFIIDTKDSLVESHFENCDFDDSNVEDQYENEIDDFLEWLDLDLEITSELPPKLETFRLIEFLSKKHQEVSNNDNTEHLDIQINLESAPDHYYKADLDMIDFYFKHICAKTVSQKIHKSLTIHVELKDINPHLAALNFHFIPDKPFNYALEKRIHKQFMVSMKNDGNITQKLFSCWDASLGFELLIHKTNNLPINFEMPIAYHNNHEYPISPKILVVDDNQINRLQIAKLFKKWQYQFDFAINGMHALKKVAETKFDLILMDLLMTKMDGFETTLAIRNSNNPNNNIPIIAMTALINPSQTAQIIKVGMNDFLPKPIRDNDLHKMLMLHLKETSCPQDLHHNSHLESIKNHFNGDIAKAISSIELFLQNHKSDLMTLPSHAHQLSKNEFLNKLDFYFETAEQLGLGSYFAVLHDIKVEILKEEKLYMPLVTKSAEQFKMCFSSIESILEELKQTRIANENFYYREL